jgi:hypothetical protein
MIVGPGTVAMSVTVSVTAGKVLVEMSVIISVTVGSDPVTVLTMVDPCSD